MMWEKPKTPIETFMKQDRVRRLLRGKKEQLPKKENMVRVGVAYSDLETGDLYVIMDEKEEEK